MNRSSCLFACLLIGAFWSRLSAQTATAGEIAPAAVLEKIKSEIPLLIVDVRTAEEFKGELGHIPSAVLVPIQVIEAKPDTLAKFKDREIVTVCRSGRRSLNAANILAAKGYNVKSMTGGMTEWNRLKYPIKK
jgi:rhodanese-related sulfurtransferase